MKKHIDIKSLVIGCLLGAMILFSIAATTSRTTSWEYRIVKAPTTNSAGSPTLEREINTAVGEGWDLLQVLAGDNGGPFAVMRRTKK